MATQFSTPRHAARRIGTIAAPPPPAFSMPASFQAHPDPSLPVEDDRFTSPRGAAASSYDSPRHELTSYSSDEREDDSMADSSPRSTGLLSRSSLRQPLSILPPTPPQRRSYYKDIAFAKPVKPVD
ncbi:hypothetical protein AaE_004313, partial [Aphanomyces astaci]